MQLKAGKWPLYRFAGDEAPGDVNGQGSGDVWFVARPPGEAHQVAAVSLGGREPERGHGHRAVSMATFASRVRSFALGSVLRRLEELELVPDRRLRVRRPDGTVAFDGSTSTRANGSARVA